MDAVTTLIRRIFPWPVAIITDSEDCAKRFSQSIKAKLTDLLIERKMSPDYGIVTYNIQDSNLVQDVSRILFVLTTRLVTTVILVCKDYMAELIFKQGFYRGIPTADQIWILFESMSAFDDKIAPKQLLNLKYEGNIDRVKHELDYQAVNLLNVGTLPAIGDPAFVTDEL